MSKSVKMTLKTFTEEYTKILESYHTEQLRSILRNMAQSVVPRSRHEFIDKLLLQNLTAKQAAEPSNAILAEIELLVENIRAQSEEEPDWDEFYDNEDDSLGEFAQFIPVFYTILDKVETCFSSGNYSLVRNACHMLNSIFEIQDDYGRGISINDLNHVTWDEIRAKYLRSIYLTEQKSTLRVKHILQVMFQLSELDSFSNAPKLEDMVDISLDPLPEWMEFLQQWIQTTKSKSSLQYDTWYREGVSLLYGAEGLKELAKTEGKQRPRVYIDWVRVLIESKEYHAASDAIQEALDQLPKNHPIRSIIGDFQVLCGKQLNNKDLQLQGQWISFDVKPDLSKLVMLYQQVEPIVKTEYMHKAAQSVKTYEQRMQAFSKKESWGTDNIESPSNPTPSLLMHAYLFSGNLVNAFLLAQQGAPLGWSNYNNPQPLFVVFCLAKMTGQPLNALPTPLKTLTLQMWSSSKGTWMYDETHGELLSKLEMIYAELLTHTYSIPNEMFDWCLKIAEQRISGIVGNQHRSAYVRAALLTAACADSIKFMSSTDASLFFNKIKNKFPRHSAFQSELRQVMSSV